MGYVVFKTLFEIELKVHEKVDALLLCGEI